MKKYLTILTLFVSIGWASAQSFGEESLSKMENLDEFTIYTRGLTDQWTVDKGYFDEQFNKISLPEYLDRLVTQGYFPIREDNRFGLHAWTGFKKQVQGTIIANLANIRKHQIDLIGEGFPLESFGLEGKGLVVVKCWFLGCEPCIAEIPMANEMYERWNDKVSFIALALDDHERLVKSKYHQQLKYKGYGGQGELMQEDFELLSFPTNILVENGVISFVSGSIEPLYEYLKEKMN